MTTYVVKQGDYLAKIAASHGFANWRAIYTHPNNATLRSLRPNPNILLPGDEIYIPDQQPNRSPAAPTQTNKYRLERQRVVLRIAIKDERGNAIAVEKYDLSIAGETHSASQAQGGSVQNNLKQGVIEQSVPSDAGQGQLRVFPTSSSGSEYDVTVQVGHLDPHDSVSGVQARLNHLGIDCGAVDGILGPRTESALRIFQNRFGLAVTGNLDQATCTKLKSVHGC